MNDRIAYSVKEAAQKIGVSKRLLEYAVRDGLVPMRKFRGRSLILAADLEAATRRLPLAREAA